MTKLRYSILDTIFWVPSLKILSPVHSLKFANEVKLAIYIFLFYFSCYVETQLTMRETRKTSNLSPKRKKSFTKRNPLWMITLVQKSPIQSALRTLTPLSSSSSSSSSSQLKRQHRAIKN